MLGIFEPTYEIQRRTRKKHSLLKCVAGALSLALAGSLGVSAPAYAANPPAGTTRINHTSLDATLTCGYANNPTLSWTTQMMFNDNTWKNKKLAAEYKISYVNLVNPKGAQKLNLSGYNYSSPASTEKAVDLLHTTTTNTTYSYLAAGGLPIGTHQYSITHSAKRHKETFEYTDAWSQLVPLTGENTWTPPVTGKITVIPARTVSIPKPTLVRASDGVGFSLNFTGLIPGTGISLLPATSKRADSAGNLSLPVAPKKDEQTVEWSLDSLNDNCAVTTGATNGEVVVPGNPNLSDVTAVSANLEPQYRYGEPIHVNGVVSKRTLYTTTKPSGQVKVQAKTGSYSADATAWLNTNTGTYGANLQTDRIGTFDLGVSYESANADIQNATSERRTFNIVPTNTEIRILTERTGTTHGMQEPLRLIVTSPEGLAPSSGTLQISYEHGPSIYNYPMTYDVGPDGEVLVLGSTLNSNGKFTFKFISKDARFTSPTDTTITVATETRAPVAFSLDSPSSSTIVYGEPLKIPYTVSSSDGYPFGKITWRSDGTTPQTGETSLDIQRAGNLDITGLSVGERTITALFETGNASRWPNGQVRTTKVTVLPAPSTVSPTKTERSTDDNSPVVVRVAPEVGNEILTGRIEAYRAETRVASADLIGGIATMSAESFALSGDYTFKFIPASNNYRIMHTNESPKLVVAPPQISLNASLSDETPVFGEDLVVSIGVASTYALPVEGYYLVTYSNGESHIVPISVAQHSVQLNAGSHHADIKFVSSNSVPSQGPVRLTFEVQKRQSQIQLRSSVLDTTNNLELSLNVPQGIRSPSGTLTFTGPDGTESRINADKEVSVPSGSFTTPGIYSVSYSGDANYLPSTEATEFQVTRKPTGLSIADIQTEYSGTNGVHVPVIGLSGTGLDSTREGRITTTISDQIGNAVSTASNEIADFAANEFTHSFENLPVGSYTVQATYTRDRDNYSITSSPANLNVVPAKTEIIPEIGSFQSGWKTTDDVKLVVVASSGSKPNGSVVLSGPKTSQSTEIDVTAGAVRIPSSMFTNEGVYRVQYTGDSAHSGSTARSFQVSRASVGAKVTWMSHAYGKSSTITFSGLPSDATGTVLLELLKTGKSFAKYTATVVNGSAKVSVPAQTISAGSYSVRATYSGNPRYLGSVTTPTTVYEIVPVKPKLVTQWNPTTRAFTFSVETGLPTSRAVGSIVWEVFDAGNRRVKNGSLTVSASGSKTHSTGTSLKNLVGGTFTLKARFSSAVSNVQGTTSTSTFSLAKASAPKAASRATVSGNVRFGKTLTAKPGVWKTSGLSFKYQWLRDGKAISGATKRKYTLTKKDIAKRISVRVVAAKVGYVDGISTSSRTTRVGKSIPNVTAKLSKTSIKKSKSLKVTVRVKATAFAKPTGKVTVKVGKKTFVRSIKSKHNGKITLVVKGLDRGARQKVTVKFTPTGSSKSVLTSKTSVAKRLTVR